MVYLSWGVIVGINNKIMMNCTNQSTSQPTSKVQGISEVLSCIVLLKEMILARFYLQSRRLLQTNLEKFSA